MISPVVTWGILIYELLQVVVAFIAVVLALHWEKLEFLAGLFFLLIYTILDLVDIFFFSIVHGVYLDVAQFGFILLAIVFFIFGMSPYWRSPGPSGGQKGEPEGAASGDIPIFSYLKKI